jgi:hypothetical protein
MNTVVTNNGFFLIGSRGPNGTGSQFCEDFNENLLCSNGANNNGCNNNLSTPAGKTVVSDPSANPTANTTSTVCGNGKVDAFEECDPGTAAQGTVSNCTTACRCAGGTSFTGNSTTACNAGGGSCCQ